MMQSLPNMVMALVRKEKIGKTRETENREKRTGKKNLRRNILLSTNKLTMNSKLNTGKNLHVNNTINSRKQQKQMQCTKKN